MAKRFYHRTTPAAARSILAEGFRDGRGTFMASKVHEGVWLSDAETSADQNNALLGLHAQLQVDLDVPDGECERFRWDEGFFNIFEPYREYLVPAALINEKGIVRRVTTYYLMVGDEIRDSLDDPNLEVGDPLEELARWCGRILPDDPGSRLALWKGDAAGDVMIAQVSLDSSGDALLVRITGATNGVVSGEEE